jgi:hypothetical protein
VSLISYHDHAPQRIPSLLRVRINNDALLAHLKTMHAQTRGEQGCPGIWRELHACGIRVVSQRVRKLMQLPGQCVAGKPVRIAQGRASARCAVCDASSGDG